MHFSISEDAEQALCEVRDSLHLLEELTGNVPSHINQQGPQIASHLGILRRQLAAVIDAGRFRD